MNGTFNADQLARQKSRVTVIGALVNLFLTAIKIFFGIIGHSAALIADGIHSLSDLLSDLVVLMAIKLGGREADYNHPYGHRRFETIATVALGGGLILIAGGISVDVGERILHPSHLLIPDKNTLGIAMISILANEWLYQYTKRIGKQTRSKLLLANAWHHRSDALSSVVVLIGIGAVLAGYTYADAIAAIIVALMVAKIGLSLVLESIKELVDTSLPSSQVAKIHKEIAATEGVEGIHLLRTRQMGEDACVDAHIIVDPRISVSEGHRIGDSVRDNLKARFDEVNDVLVHIDPEDDEFKTGSSHLLSRREVLACLKLYLPQIKQQVENIRIHYLDNGIEIELILPYKMHENTSQVAQIKQQCALLEREVQEVAKVQVFIKA